MAPAWRSGASCARLGLGAAALGRALSSALFFFFSVFLLFGAGPVVWAGRLGGGSRWSPGFCGGALWLFRWLVLVRWSFPVVRWLRRCRLLGGVGWSGLRWVLVPAGGGFGRLGGRFLALWSSLASVLRLPRRLLLRLGRRGLASRSRFAGFVVPLGRSLASRCRLRCRLACGWPFRRRCPVRSAGWLSRAAPPASCACRLRCGLSLALAWARLSPRLGGAVRLCRSRRAGLSPCAAVRLAAASGLGSACAASRVPRRPAVPSLASLRWASRFVSSPSSAWPSVACPAAWWPLGLACASPWACCFAQARAVVLVLLLISIVFLL